jgi:hypothetical protein
MTAGTTARTSARAGAWTGGSPGAGTAVPAEDEPALRTGHLSLPDVESAEVRARTAADRVRRQTATVALLLLGVNASVSVGLSTGLLATLGLLPVWCTSLPRYRGAVPIAVLTLASLPAGLVLDFASGDRDVDARTAIEVSLRLVTAIGGVGLILWCREFLPPARIAVVLGSGWLLAALANSPGSENPWKYELAVPVTLVVLGLTAGARSRRPVVAALLVLAAVGVVNEHRSYLGFCLATLGLLLWQARPVRGSRRLPALGQVALLALSAYVVYRLATLLLVNGLLGYDLQQRSLQQIRDGGSLLVGGRPEITATARLLQEYPGGFGVGAVPRSADVMVAKQGLVTAGVPTHNGYIDRFMFGGQFKLHSVAADLWSNFGLVGLLLGAVIALTILLSLTARMADRKASALVLFLALTALWDVAFSPLYSGLPDLTPALGLLLLRRDRPRRDPWADDPPLRDPVDPVEAADRAEPAPAR